MIELGEKIGDRKMSTSTSSEDNNNKKKYAAAPATADVNNNNNPSSGYTAAKPKSVEIKTVFGGTCAGKEEEKELYGVQSLVIANDSSLSDSEFIEKQLSSSYSRKNKK